MNRRRRLLLVVAAGVTVLTGAGVAVAGPSGATPPTYRTCKQRVVVIQGDEISVNPTTKPIECYY